MKYFCHFINSNYIKTIITLTFICWIWDHWRTFKPSFWDIESNPYSFTCPMRLPDHSLLIQPDLQTLSPTPKLWLPLVLSRGPNVFFLKAFAHVGLYMEHTSLSLPFLHVINSFLRLQCHFHRTLLCTLIMPSIFIEPWQIKEGVIRGFYGPVMTVINSTLSM